MKIRLLLPLLFFSVPLSAQQKPPVVSLHLKTESLGDSFKRNFQTVEIEEPSEHTCRNCSTAEPEEVIIQDERGDTHRLTPEKNQSSTAKSNMVRISAGTFRMGSSDGGSDEKPVHEVSLDAYAIDVYEVTVEQYEQCVNAGKCGKPETGGYYNWGKSERGKHPINGVDWDDAKDYCAFAGKRLPTEAEWEKAASWKDGKKYKYPSGKSSVSCKDAVMNEGGKGCGKERTWPVGSKPREINGTFDMAGNVWEWTADWYGDYQSHGQKNPEGPTSGSFRMRRGGGWNYYSDFLRGANRSLLSPSLRGSGLGFRCVVSQTF